MQIEITPENITNWISEILRIPSHFDGNDVEFDLTEPYERSQRFERQPNRPFPLLLTRRISTEKLHLILETLRKKDEHQDSGIFDKYSYEVLVTEETPISMSRLRNDNFTLQDTENEVTYTLSYPSDHYLIYLLFRISQIAPLRLLTIISTRVGRNIDDPDKSILDILKTSSPRFKTLQVTSTKPLSISEFTKYANSFYFHLSFNLDIAIVPQRGFDELVRMGRIERVRRSTIEDLAAPSRFYNADLVHYYQEGVASDSPPLQFLSYYHVAEHFFEGVYNEDLIERVKQIITQPDFSYKRKKDVNALIKKIGKWVSFRNETMIFNEQEALALTLQNFVELNTLTQKIKEYDDTLFDYYKSNAVVFSGGESVDFDNNDQQAVCSSLAKRIYKTRNAIVHSKENEKGKYIPFEHEKILVKEVPLVRFIAELIIIESSEIIQ